MMMMMMMMNQVEGSMMVLYTSDVFHWSQQTLMVFNMYQFVIIICGQFLCFPFLSQICQVPLALILAMYSISRAGYYALLASCSE